MVERNNRVTARASKILKYFSSFELSYCTRNLKKKWVVFEYSTDIFLKSFTFYVEILNLVYRLVCLDLNVMSNDRLVTVII